MSLDLTCSPEQILKKSISLIKSTSNDICAVKINHHLLLPLSLNDLKRLLSVIHNNNLLAIADLKLNDTINLKAKVKVLDVCQAKGCWMIVDLGNDETARVKFKEYAFFMPKDIKGQEVIINGKAFVNEMPVDELKHYAEDAGKSEEEIAAITTPERTFSFEADGVLLEE